MKPSIALRSPLTRDRGAISLSLVFVFLLFLLLPSSTARAQDDPRNLRHGWTIPDEGYCDQPYIVIADDGAWVCVMTTGRGVEGQSGQHVVSARSLDRGRTWSALTDIEPSDGPEASWAMPLKVPSGRLYVFYTYNIDNLRAVPGANHEGAAKRVDTIGAYVFKYSDDHGRTWSKDRRRIELPTTRMDRENGNGGKTQFFWGVGKPMIAGSSMHFGYAKVGKWGVPGALVRSRGMVMTSRNILTEPDPNAVRFESSPQDDEGLAAPKGPICEETNLAMLSDGALCAILRTIDGYPCESYSRDGGRTWSKPAYVRYGTEPRPLKHPRAACFIRKLNDGAFLLWHHFQGGEAVHASAWDYYQGRNPAWLSLGVEHGGRIRWSEPDILLYDDDPAVRISYPDFIEDGGRLYVTETQKTIARVHQVEPGLLDLLSRQARGQRGLVLKPDAETVGDPIPPGRTLDLPEEWPNLSRGFAIDLDVRFDELTRGQILFDSRDRNGAGLVLETSERFTLRLVLSDGQTRWSWDSDPGTGPGSLKVGQRQRIAVLVDGPAKVAMFVVDGCLNDGGPIRQYGWTRLPANLTRAVGNRQAKIAPSMFGRLFAVRAYNRRLSVSEAVMSLPPLP